MSSIHSLFEAISTSSSEQELRFRFMDGVTKHFEVQRWGVYLLDEDCKNLASVDVVGVSDTGYFIIVRFRHRVEEMQRQREWRGQRIRRS